MKSYQIYGGNNLADKTTEKVKELMRIPEKIRNIGVCAHIDMS